MGIFDKVEKDAEEAMAQDDPRLAQQAGQAGGGQLSGGQTGCGQTGCGQLSADRLSRDMRAAQRLVGQQRGAPDQDEDRDQGGGDQDYSDEDW